MISLFLLYHHHFITHLLSSDLSTEFFFKSHYLLFIHIFSWWIPSKLHVISMLYPTLLSVQGHLSSSPVYLLMLLFNSKYLSYICHCFCPRILSLQIISHYILPSCQNLTQWLLMLLPHLFQLLLPPLWPGSLAVVVSWLLLQVYFLSHLHLNHKFFQPGWSRIHGELGACLEQTCGT